jgi:hypothetical protein
MPTGLSNGIGHGGRTRASTGRWCICVFPGRSRSGPIPRGPIGEALQVCARADEFDLYRGHLKPEGLFLHFGLTQPPALKREADCEALMRRIERW